MICKICTNKSEKKFSAKILGKYNIKYFYCDNCGFLQTEEPYWLDEAYNNSINFEDTGILLRNLYLRKLTLFIIRVYFNSKKNFLDYAGGYGIFTRLMRDIGLNFFWNDPYSNNLLSRGFEYNKKNKIELITSFESFEHFVNPLEDIEKILKISNNILFTTDVIDENIPYPDKWRYYGLSHGQHISFYQIKTLKYIAKKYNLNLYTNGINIHLLTNKNKFLFTFLLKILIFIPYSIIKLGFKSKTFDDMNIIISNKKKVGKK